MWLVWESILLYSLFYRVNDYLKVDIVYFFVDLDDNFIYIRRKINRFSFKDGRVDLNLVSLENILVSDNSKNVVFFLNSWGISFFKSSMFIRVEIEKYVKDLGKKY